MKDAIVTGVSVAFVVGVVAVLLYSVLGVLLTPKPHRTRFADVDALAEKERVRAQKAAQGGVS